VTRIDFYLIKNHPPGGKHRLACRLADKAYRMGHKIYVYTGNTDESNRLNELLWTFGPSSFVPHTIYEKQDQAESLDQVLIGHEEPPKEFNDVLICLSPQVRTFFSRFERMAELVDNSDDDRKLARERFSFYRDRGYPLDTHEVTV